MAQGDIKQACQLLKTITTTDHHRTLVKTAMDLATENTAVARTCWKSQLHVLVSLEGEELVGITGLLKLPNYDILKQQFKTVSWSLSFDPLHRKDCFV